MAGTIINKKRFESVFKTRAFVKSVRFETDTHEGIFMAQVDEPYGKHQISERQEKLNEAIVDAVKKTAGSRDLRFVPVLESEEPLKSKKGEIYTGKNAKGENVPIYKLVGIEFGDGEGSGTFKLSSIKVKIPVGKNKEGKILLNNFTAKAGDKLFDSIVEAMRELDGYGENSFNVPVIVEKAVTVENGKRSYEYAIKVDFDEIKNPNPEYAKPEGEPEEIETEKAPKEIREAVPENTAEEMKKEQPERERKAPVKGLSGLGAPQK